MDSAREGVSCGDFDEVSGREDADKGEGERADTMLCETSDKRIEARFWLLVNLEKL